MEVTGIIKVIGPLETYANDFTKKSIVITTQEQYPQPIQIEFIKAAIEKLNGFKVGDSVVIGINIKGREWESPDKGIKYFNSIQGWRIEANSENTEQTSKQPVTSESDDDLPF